MIAFSKLSLWRSSGDAARPDRAAAERLVALCRADAVPRPDAEGRAFEALRHCALVGEAIDADAAAWLRRVLGGHAGPAERRWLAELHTRARRVCPEFQRLLDEFVRR